MYSATGYVLASVAHDVADHVVAAFVVAIDVVGGVILFVAVYILHPCHFFPWENPTDFPAGTKRNPQQIAKTEGSVYLFVALGIALTFLQASASD